MQWKPTVLAEEEIVTIELDEDVEPSPDGVAELIEFIRFRVATYNSGGRRCMKAPTRGRRRRSAGGTNGPRSQELPIYGVFTTYARQSSSVRPFENLGDLPDDLAEAFDAFKLAILRHKQDSWEQNLARRRSRQLDAG